MQKTEKQCWDDVGPPFMMLAQHRANIDICGVESLLKYLGLKVICTKRYIVF